MYAMQGGSGLPAWSAIIILCLSFPPVQPTDNDAQILVEQKLGKLTKENLFMTAYLSILQTEQLTIF